MWLILNLQREVKLNICPSTKISFPEGAEGFCWVFKTKQDARKWMGKNIKFAKISIIKGEK